MGILRADVISHSPIEGDAEGSIVLDGTGDYLTFGTSPEFTMGTGDFTVEFWYYLTTFDASSGNYYFFDSGTNKIRIQFYNGNLYFGDDSVTNFGAIGQTLNTWYHVAGVRKSGVLELFLNGVSQGTAATTKNNTGDDFTIANHGGGGSSGDYEPYGYMSNFRLVKGTAVYTDNFVVPRFPLKNIPGTVLLGLQSSGEVDFSVKPSAVTVHGNAAAASLSPLKKDKSDVGIVFGDNTKFDTLSYMVPPGGTTAQRGRGRAVFAGGNRTPDNDSNIIDYVQIQSSGSSIDFGDLTQEREALGGSGNETRGWFASGYDGDSPNANYDIIDYITISTTANALDFGNLSAVRRYVSCLSNSTRGIIGGGYNTAFIDTIEYITIATIGNVTDFGNLTVALTDKAGLSSPTRGVFAGGLGAASNPTATDVIDYITIASTGDATDFGNLTVARRAAASANSSTRGVFGGGHTPTVVNTIDYITIASTGNATDFGDLTAARGYMGKGQACTVTRGLFQGGIETPVIVNTIEYIDIATTGNAADFGDLSSNGVREAAACSDSHGGIS